MSDNGAFITNCYSSVDMAANKANIVGGLVGVQTYGAVIKNCYATGDVAADGEVGGLVGINDGTIRTSYATGDVIGHTCNGLEGRGGEGSGCYYTGNVTVDGVRYGNVGMINMQIGINGDDSCRIEFESSMKFDLSAVKRIGLKSCASYEQINNFMKTVNEKSIEFGAAQNRLESALESTSVNIENLTSSRSTLRDADIAKESSKFIQQQILQQAAATLMSTANQTPAIALQLI